MIAVIDKLRTRIRTRFEGDELARNRATIITENSVNSLHALLVVITFITGLLLLLNVETAQLGLINIIANFCNLLQLFSPLLLERFASRKRLLIAARTIIHVLNIAMIGLAANLPIDTRVRVYIILGIIAIQNTVSAFTAMGFSVWHIQSVPERVRANYFSINIRIVNLAAYVFILLGGFFIDAMKARGLEMEGFMLLRGVAVLFAVADIFLLTRIKEYEYPKGTTMNLKALFTEPFKAPLYLISVLVIFLWSFFANTTSSFYSVYMLQTVKASYTFLNLNSAMSVPVLLFVSPFWTRFFNRSSWFAVYWKVLLAYGAIYCLYPFVLPTNYLWFHTLVNLAIFTLSPANSLVINNTYYYNIPKANQTLYLSFNSTFASFGAILGNLVATQYMLRSENFHPVILGVQMQNNQFLPMITGCLIMLMGVIIFFLHRREVRQKAKTPPEGDDPPPEDAAPAA